jgi:hypothetical protein
MKKTTICTSQRMYLVKFQFSGADGKFITTELAKCIKENEPNNGRGIEYIKTYDPVKNTFKRISKDAILMFHSWDTEAMEFFRSHYFFK